MGQIYCADCLKVLKTIPHESIALVFADPPFNIGKKYGGKSSNDNREDYYAWCAEWIELCFAALKPTGSFYLMTLSKHVVNMGYEMQKYGVFINLVQWRNVSASHSKRGFWNSTQPILLFGKTDQYKFNTDRKSVV
jgi:site-specific DNA-methyltransferase (adenine-specific)